MEVDRADAGFLQGCTKRAMDGAADKGFLGVVKWLHQERLEGCTSDALSQAAKVGLGFCTGG